MALPNYEFVEVSWVDAEATSSWHAPNDFQEELSKCIVTRGWRIAHTNDSMTICASWDSESGDVNCCQTIPLTVIRAVRILECHEQQ
jgi:hypothetical protein